MSATTKKKRRGSGTAASTRDVAEWIRERIRIGRFVPGQRLVEADIIAELGASRSKVREALQRLETEGLIAIEEFRGASVKRIGWDEVRQIYRARMALEGLAAAEFAAADAPELKSELEALQKEMDKWKENGGHERFAELNTAWHSLIVKGANNVYLGEFLTRLAIPIYRLRFSSFYTDKRVDEANASHQEVTAAIIEGDAKRAEQAMRNHVSQGFAALSEIKAQHII